MNWLDLPSQECSMYRTLAVIGEKWTLLLIRDAANGVHRFDDYHRHLGVSEAVLADRLRTLVDNGILETREYREPGQRARRSYRLTGKGWDLLPVLVALKQWGDTNLPTRRRATWQVIHSECGHPVRAVIRCEHDGAEVTERETALVAG